MATINIIEDLVNDQSAGVTDDDVEITVVGGIIDGLSDDFENYLNALGLSPTQLAFADSAEAAAQVDLLTVSVAANEVVENLVFAPMTNVDSGLTTVDGDAILLTTVAGGTIVEGRTAGGDLVVAFHIIPGVDNLSASVEMVTFEAIDHPIFPDDHDDRVDFTGVLKVRAYSYIDEDIGDDTGIDDDGPDVSILGGAPTLLVDDETLNSDDSDDFSVIFDTAFGTDGEAASDPVEYVLGTPGGGSGIFDTATGQEAILSEVNGTIEGRTAGGDLVFVISVDASGNVTLDQQRAVQHVVDDVDDTVGLAAGAVTLTAIATDGDGDTDDATADIGESFTFSDDLPEISRVGDLPEVLVDETFLNVSADGNFGDNFLAAFGADGFGSIDFDLEVTANVLPGATDTATGESIELVKIGDTIVGRTSVGLVTVFTVAVDLVGNVTFTQARSITHADTSNPDDIRTLGDAALITLTATIEDGDGDSDSLTIEIGDRLKIADDGPTITQSFDGNPDPETIGNTAGATASGLFAYDVGADPIRYLLGESDFADADLVTAGIQQLLLTGTVDNAQNPNITNVVTSLVSEDADSALFNFSFHYDKDPITAGIQDATAGGTLLFDKQAGTYTLTLTDPIDGFSFSVLHTNELQAKAPPGNTGHPELVVTQLDDFAPDNDGFYVQFTANSVTNNVGFVTNTTGADTQTGNTAWVEGEFVANNHIDWVSATQTTNGVAGDTIQKGELLTLRFFNENILGDVNPNAPGGGTEKLSPTDAVDAVAIKFDGIGNSEDLIVVLNLIDFDGADNIAGTADDNFETTKSIVVENGDLYKLSTGGVPSPYNTEFSLDNNDALLIIESNDYNFGTENYQIQGMQIMQSGNGITGSGINLNRTTDNPTTLAIEGASPSGPLQAWENTDNDVLKIVDIGFIQSTTGQIGADLAFSVNIQDGDGDTTGVQTLNVDVLA